MFAALSEVSSVCFACWTSAGQQLMLRDGPCGCRGLVWLALGCTCGGYVVVVWCRAWSLWLELGPDKGFGDQPSGLAAGMKQSWRGRSLDVGGNVDKDVVVDVGDVVVVDFVVHIDVAIDIDVDGVPTRRRWSRTGALLQEQGSFGGGF